MSIIQTLFTLIWFYYIFTVIPLSIIGMILGIYQLFRHQIYNLRHSVIWLVVSLIVIAIAKIFKLVYFPEFGCDNCDIQIEPISFVITFSYGLFGSMLIYIFPFVRLYKRILEIFKRKE